MPRRSSGRGTPRGALRSHTAWSRSKVPASHVLEKPARVSTFVHQQVDDAHVVIERGMQLPVYGVSRVVHPVDPDPSGIEWGGVQIRSRRRSGNVRRRPQLAADAGQTFGSIASEGELTRAAEARWNIQQPANAGKEVLVDLGQPFT